ncbi:serine acetyltransferase [Musa troglodytarum]|uniref:serine O-acetyltransferase n=1 Tax=Musa troglodytarum TaxID=320322 RepID=A0A9E7K9R2_9LILI|nr:serine acetyltransferase [Musa troglodytarum]
MVDEVWCTIQEEARTDAEEEPFLRKQYYDLGFQALQAHRVAHRLWTEGRRAMALLLQSRTSEVLAVDIHPGARIGAGVLLNHATGVEGGDRHPKIGDGVLLGAGTKILGNVRIGEGTKIGAGSVVLKVVPPRTTTVGSAAALVNGEENRTGHIIDHTSCSNYAN